MTLEELVTELKARGFDYLPTSRCQRYLNDAYLLDICETEDWPFLNASEEGPAPLTIADLRSIHIVINSSQGYKLSPVDPREITDNFDSDLSRPGNPAFWYLTNDQTIAVFPTSGTDKLLVTYLRAPSALQSTDSPVLPTRFHTLIVDGAVARAYEDSDDYELAQNARENFEARLARMRESLLGQNRDVPGEYIAIIDPGDAA